MQVVLKNNEIEMAKDSLEFYFRIFIGQYNEFYEWFHFHLTADNYVIEHTDEDVVEMGLIGIRSIVIPTLNNRSLQSSLGIFNEITDKRAQEAYDIFQCIRSEYAWFKNPCGGNTVDFQRPWNPHKKSMTEYPVCKAYSKEQNDYVSIELSNDQFMIMYYAAFVLALVLEGKYQQVLSYFTSNENALWMAEKLRKYLPRAKDCTYLQNAIAYRDRLNKSMRDETGDRDD